ncbi:MAG: uracil-DNA glycosylase [Bacteroidales bacterium]|nr:uracil-DNA glycosylase [Bacteroidales bacterium]
MDPKIEVSWKNALKDEFNSEYFHALRDFLIEEKKKYAIYPSGSDIFSAFDYTPFENVKAVILGQDPYHGKGQANGLCFSVSDGIKPPPSLVNIFKEIKNDLGIETPTTGNLEKWARQGVLLINATLTVRANQAGSHQNKGWEIFTDSIIKNLSENRSGLVFLLWGNFAKAKQQLIDKKKHYILKSAHPSPFSAYNGFFGCKHFSKTNEILKQLGNEEIDWSL